MTITQDNCSMFFSKKGNELPISFEYWASRFLLALNCDWNCSSLSTMLFSMALKVVDSFLRVADERGRCFSSLQ